MHVGPSDHVPWLKDRKWAYIRMEGRNFGDVPLNLELKLEVWDSPNSAGVIIDAVRCAKLALDRGIGGPLLGPSAYFMKSPPVQYHDDVAHALVEAFAAGEPQETWPPADDGHPRSRADRLDQTVAGGQTRMRSSGARTPTTAIVAAHAEEARRSRSSRSASSSSEKAACRRSQQLVVHGQMVQGEALGELGGQALALAQAVAARQSVTSA